MKIRVQIQPEDFDSGAEIKRLSAASQGVGGINSFIGFVRDNNLDDQVARLHLEHYPGMTEKQIEKIIDEAGKRWQIIAASVVHRIGLLNPGEAIVFVGVACAHRGDAFEACQYVIDYLKTRATFWKKETTSEGDRWLETRQTDIDSAAGWEQP